MESILNSVKKDLGIMPDYTHFDDSLIMDINVAFSTLTQLGVGPSEGFSISDATAVWTDFIPDTSPWAGLLKKYVSEKTRLLFDSNTLSSTVIESLRNNISELEWRLNVAYDPTSTFE